MNENTLFSHLTFDANNKDLCLYRKPGIAICMALENKLVFLLSERLFIQLAR